MNPEISKNPFSVTEPVTLGSAGSAIDAQSLIPKRSALKLPAVVLPVTDGSQVNLTVPACAPDDTPAASASQEQLPLTKLR